MESSIHSVNWYVAFTRPRAEHLVASTINEMGAESFLPLQTVVRQWSDRKKKLKVPLFPSYVFVKGSDIQRRSLLTINGLVRFVSIEKKPVIVREKEIEIIKTVLNTDVQVHPSTIFRQGTKVRITSGQLTGVEGVVVNQGPKARLHIKVDALQKVLSINIPANVVEVIP